MYFQDSFRCIFYFLLTLTVVHGNPLKEVDDDPAGLVNGIGKKALNKFDQVFYGLVDEAAQFVTDDKRGAFKEMLIRHRGDLVNNVKENLVNNSNVTLEDVKKTFGREIQNRLEMFNYVGSGIWNKLSSWTKKLYNQYNDYCSNGKGTLCMNRSTKSLSSDGIEREYV